MTKIVTEQSVEAAAEAIRGRGERPTIFRVRQELGGGSPNDIGPLLNAWKDAQRSAPPVEQPEVQEEPEAREVAALEDLPELSQSLDDLLKTILTTVNAIVQRERAAATTAQQAIQSAADQKVRLAREAADQQMADLQTQTQADVAEAREEAQELGAALEQAETALAEKTAEAAKIRCAAEQLDQSLAEAQEHALKANERATVAEQRAKSAEAQLAENKKAAAAEIARLNKLVESAEKARTAEISRLEKLIAEIRQDAADKVQSADAAVSKIRDEAATATTAANQRATRAEERADRAEARAEAAEKKATESHERVLALLERLQLEQQKASAEAEGKNTTSKKGSK